MASIAPSPRPLDLPETLNRLRTALHARDHGTLAALHAAPLTVACPDGQTVLADPDAVASHIADRLDRLARLGMAEARLETAVHRVLSPLFGEATLAWSLRRADGSRLARLRQSLVFRLQPSPTIVFIADHDALS
jgi:hypothetical protein